MPIGEGCLGCFLIVMLVVLLLLLCYIGTAFPLGLFLVLPP